MDLKTFHCRVLSENCYVLSDGDACVVVDPGFYSDEEFGEFLKLLGDCTPSAILLTHAHFDHCMGVVRMLAKWPGLPVYMHTAETVSLSDDTDITSRLDLHGQRFDFPWKAVEDGMEITIGKLVFRAIHTPGHSPGALCWYCEAAGLAFTGDTLFAGTIGRTDLAHADYDSLIRSIMEKLILLPGSTDIYPGHGWASTIGREMRTNPFLEPFNEPAEGFDPDMPGVELHTL
ncbi:MAG: MBL fold metallo-hydrolase [Bacteroidales bacterium]|nr:MBL fold metallo-hydrolase [Bacteroidales bacterium]